MYACYQAIDDFALAGVLFAGCVEIHRIPNPIDPTDYFPEKRIQKTNLGVPLHDQATTSWEQGLNATRYGAFCSTA